MTDSKSSPPLIVAIGASAGGLEALSELLPGLGDEPGFAIVFVQHLDPNNKSLLADLLRKQTSLTVEEIKTRSTIRPDTIYLCPPRAGLELRGESLTVADRGGDRKEANNIDHFFHSIAQSQGDRGIGIILSGTGSDGTLGLKSISDSGGMTFAQDAASAKFDAMPRNAATTGVADHVMTPRQIADELVIYAGYLEGLVETPASKKFDDQIKKAIPDIADLLLRETGHNFNHYKKSTLARRIQRRMQVLKLTGVDQYIRAMAEEPQESKNLFRELLIGVTAFFRDPEAFERLAGEVIPKLFVNRMKDDVVRIWVPGCASGEEAYTIAILCREHADSLGEQSPSFQIFASDIDERALSVARTGIYPSGIADYVSSDRLKKFFIKKGKRYHVKKELRRTVLFSSHNLISDPPFSRQDLISCRNLLIYLGPHLQKKLIPLFHFALRPDGFLFLGPSENISSHGDLFRPVDLSYRISQRKGTTIGNATPLALRTPGGEFIRPSGTLPIDDEQSDVVQIMQRIILDEFAPKCVVIDEDGQVICSSAETNKFLTIGEGAYQNNILKMARRGLRIGLRATLAEAKSKCRRVVHENLSVGTDEGKQRVMITVQPMMRLSGESGLYIVVFHDVGLPMGSSANPTPSMEAMAARGAMDRQADELIEQLERELTTTRDDLERTMQEMETTNEELKSSNEELLSMNEELQSANEELETSKEEIRASSEAISRVNTDLENLLRSTQIATIFLDNELNIRSFTPAATSIYSLIDTDVGRPLSTFTPKVIGIPDLPGIETLRDNQKVEHRVRCRDGRTYMRRVLPYQDQSGKTDGLVVTFTDITQLDRRERHLAFIADLQTELVSLRMAEELQQTACEKVAEHFNASRCCFIHFDEDGQYVRVVNDLKSDDFESLLGRYQRADFYTDLEYQAFQSGNPVVIGNVDEQVDDLDRRDQFQTQQIQSVCCVGFKRDGNVRYVLATSMNHRHDWSEHEIQLLRDVIDRLGLRVERAEAETQLAHAKEQMELALEISKVASWTWDFEHNRPRHNSNLNRLFGFDPDSVPAVSEFIDRIDADHRDRVAAAIEHVLTKGGLYKDEYPINLPDGEVRWVQAYGRGSTPGELPRRFLGVITDITQRKHTELDLLMREGHLRQIMDGTPFFFAVLDSEGTMLEVNNPALESAGLTREEAIGSPFWETYWWNFSEENSQTLKSMVQRAAGGEAIRLDLIYRMAGDVRRPVDFSLTPIRNSDGNVTHIVPSGVDIGDRYAASQQLAESRSRLKMAMSAAKMGAFVWDRISDEVVWDEEWMRAVGIEDNVERTGKTFFAMIHPDDLEHLKTVTQESLEGKSEYRIEFRIIRPDGETRWLAGAGNWITDAEGQPRKLAGINWDITESKEYALQIKLNEERLRVAAGAAGFGMFHVDVDNQQVHWSEEFRRLVGLGPDEFTVEIGGLPDFIHPDDVERVDAHLQRVLGDLDEPDHWLNHRILRKNGEVRHVRLQTRSLCEGKGNQKRIKLIVGTLLDITSQHDFEQKLKNAKRIAEAANASKSQFVANMSHEIRTPMTAILGYAEMLLERVSDDESRSYLSTICRNGDYLLEIINDILDLSKIEAGKMDIDIERFEPARVIEDVRSIMEVRATEGGIKLEVDYATPIPQMIQSDAKRLKQILINLVGNAVKFTKQGGVTIKVAYESGGLRFDVTDTGIGMTKDQCEKLFKPFSQGGSAITQEFGGTGLGLAISQRLAAMLGGTIDCESELSRGSTFTATIDIGDIESVDLIHYEASQVEANPQNESIESIRLDASILIVDDRRDIRFLSKHILGNAGATITEAEDGLLAIEKVKRAIQADQTFDLILLDMQMPNLDGYETAAALRKLGFAEPIIALTADAMQGDMNKCLDAGCNDYLSKPIDKTAMLTKVAAVLGE